MVFKRSQRSALMLAFLLLVLPGAAAAVWSTSPFENNRLEFEDESVIRYQGVTDGDGGTIAFWAQMAGPADSGSDLWARRIDADGNLLWADRVGIYATSGTDWIVDCDAVADGSGGAIVATTVYLVKQLSFCNFPAAIIPSPC
jgi:hypothetical protein